MGYLFVIECMTDPSIAAVDGPVLKAKGNVLHKSSIEKGIVPCPPGIDTDALWLGIQSYQKGMDFRIQTTFNMYNRRACSPSSSQCYYC